MFRKKYTVSMLDSKWLPIKRNVRMEFIPRTDEYIWLDNKYFIVINIVHSITDKYEIFIIVEEKFGEAPVTN
jgi:hypothetical protein